MQQLQKTVLYRLAPSASKEGAQSSFKSAGIRLAWADVLLNWVWFPPVCASKPAVFLWRVDTWVKGFWIGG